MFSRRLIMLPLLLSLALLFAVGCSDDDKSANPVTPQNTPVELVGVWEWTSTTQNGVPVASFAEVSFTDTSTSQELELMPGGFWETREYYYGTLVFVRSGTCYDDDSLYVTCTMEQGSPSSDTESQGTSWEVVGDVLTLGKSMSIPTNPPTMIVVMSDYTKQ